MGFDVRSLSTGLTVDLCLVEPVHSLQRCEFEAFTVGG